MRVQCDVCGVEPAAVLCCADEAALCAPCNRRVHHANKLVGKHRRLTLLQPPSDAADAAAPLCDVCKERRGLVFCVEDRAILCADCDDPIHSANDLMAKHSRFLLVGAKLSADPVDQEIPSPDGSSDERDHCSDAPAVVLDASHGSTGGGGGGSSSISDYLTNILPGWQVDELLFDDAAFGTTADKQKGRDEQVPFLDADLFDVVAAERPGKRGAWARHVPQTAAPACWGPEEVPASMVAPANWKAKQGHAREWNHSDSDSDVFAVPEISSPPAKRARPSSFWYL